MSEISYCIKNKLVNEKDLILYKLVIDFNEALFNNQASSSSAKFAHETLIPCSLKFYKNLSESQLQKLLEQMQNINSKIQKKQNLRRVA
jgi:hypothetical protein